MTTICYVFLQIYYIEVYNNHVYLHPKCAVFYVTSVFPQDVASAEIGGSHSVQDQRSKVDVYKHPFERFQSDMHFAGESCHGTKNFYCQFFSPFVLDRLSEFSQQLTIAIR